MEKKDKRKYEIEIGGNLGFFLIVVMICITIIVCKSI